MIIKDLIAKFIPPIFLPSNIKELALSIIRDRDKIAFEDNFYNRHAFIIKSLLKLYQEKDLTYLEIGVSKNEVFNCIPLNMSKKIGVDPIMGGNKKMTSDHFFQKNEKFFNVIFIDGLHIYEQCQKDVLNSIKFLKPNGIILIHDMIPKNSFEEHVPFKQRNSTGDVWKIAVELANSKNLDFVIANIDHGVGIVKPKNNFEYKKMPELKNYRFELFFDKYYKKLPIVSCEEALRFIDNL